eukprot:PhM_4_TR9027/c0_g2_i1/m.105637
MVPTTLYSVVGTVAHDHLPRLSRYLFVSFNEALSHLQRLVALLIATYITPRLPSGTVLLKSPTSSTTAALLAAAATTTLLTSLLRRRRNHRKPRQDNEKAISKLDTVPPLSIPVGDGGGDYHRSCISPSPTIRYNEIRLTPSPTPRHPQLSSRGGTMVSTYNSHSPPNQAMPNSGASLTIERQFESLFSQFVEQERQQQQQEQYVLDT